MKNQFAKIVAVLMVLAMAVSVFGICASAAEEATDAKAVLLGDVNLDGKVSIQDATLIQKAIAKLATLDEAQTAAADAFEDGEVNIKDATAIQKWIAKVAGANENIGKPIATADEATPDEPTTPDESTPDESTPDESTPDESTFDEATPDDQPTDPTVPTEPVIPEDPSTEDQPVVDPTVPVEPAVDAYYIAGSAGLCGAEWVVDGVKMTDDGDGTWSYTFTGIAAGSYEFKVTVGNWDLSYNLEGEAMGIGTNAIVTVPVDDATVIIGFDGEKAVIEFVTGAATEDEPVAPATEDEPVAPATEDEPVAPATEDEATTDEPVVDEPTVEYYLVGWINGADIYDTTYAFVDGTITVDFTAESYVAVQDSNGTIFWTDGWLDFNPTSAVLGSYAQNDKFHVAGGTVTFTWDATTCTLARV